ncbi:hypothetical protein JTE90_021693 [Oedothorax gibbosus]|uniref:Reverse transcriptase domain-containing protein n=1 Tax=Oedothorax gibbosus TaxID=931172 RepID=A0AAV6TU19_9ARAC|nr:hypothetical protein JTE90_021693 [Oedothorax gibbosus]
MEIFPGRTKESIKCRRKNPNYGIPVEREVRRRRAVDPAIPGITTSQTTSSRPRRFSIDTETKARKGKQRKPKVNDQSVFPNAGVNNPGDSRMISISSVIIRHYHKILSKRLSRVLDPYQFGFRPKDGLAEAVCKLDIIFSTSRRQLEPMTVALIDLKKTFDSVDLDHKALFHTMLAFGE